MPEQFRTHLRERTTLQEGVPTTQVRLTTPSMLDLALFRIAKWGIVVAVSLLYLSCYHWNLFFTPILLLTFAYSFAGLVPLLVDAVVYFLSEPLILPEVGEVLEKGIPRDIRVIMVRPIFAKSTMEMDTLLTNLRLDAVANQEPQRNLKFIVIDNTRDPSVRQYTRGRIEELQKEFGEDCVFYFHRNPKVDFFKKLGIYQDLVLFLRKGSTRPQHYVNSRWLPWTKDTRNPKEPIWDEILGDLRGLGIESPKQDVLKGNEIRVIPGEVARFAFVTDADNRWPEGSVRKMVAKMLHPANDNVTIFQPKIELSNPDENWFIRIHSWSRKMYGFDPVAKWRLYRFSPFYGKAAMNLERYVQEVVLSEALHPGKAASHDFQESLRAWTVLVEDVYVLEKSFSNKLSELARAVQWMWGDMETVAQYLVQRLEPGRTEHLWILARISAGTLVYSVWVVGTCLAWIAPGLGGVKNPFLLWVLFLTIAATSVVVPKFFVPLLESRRTQKTVPFGASDKKLVRLIEMAVIETVTSLLIHSLDLVYRSRAFLQNLIMQLRGKEFVWITAAMSEQNLSGLSLGQCYRILSLAVGIGAFFLFLSLFRLIPMGMSVFLLPYTAAFLFGPWAIWLSSKPIPAKTG